MGRFSFSSIIISILVLTILLSINSCQSYSKEELDYISTIDEWHKGRIDRLEAKDSWLSLAGLYWLKNGENSFGSGKENDIVFPADKSPALIGWFYLESEQVKVKIKPGIKVFSDSIQIDEKKLESDETGKPTVLTYQTLTWFIIKRGEKYGIRLKDSQNSALTEFGGIDRYPVKPEWRIKADFVPYEPEKKIEIPTILGTVLNETSPGALVFSIDGLEHRLDPLGKKGAKNFFIIFADQTNGKETYGAGRFVSATMSEQDSSYYIDFNKATNPPCAFTKYATCPLPPIQNQLKTEITAGEKNYSDH